MTTLLPQAHRDDGASRGPTVLPAMRYDIRLPRRGGWLARDPAWPITVMLLGWPLWWALGVADYIPIPLAIPMLVHMHRWRARRDRTIKAPPGFGIWVLFLIVMIVGAATLSLQAPETIVSPTTTRVMSWALRTASYLAVTVMLLYVGNLTEQEFPRRRLAWLLGLVGIYTVIGGLGGVVDPRFQFTSPLDLLVPRSVEATNGQIQTMFHPGFSQVQTILGYGEGRPKAPFDYTNTWGNCLIILLPWLLVVWWSGAKRWHRWACVGLVAVALAPAVYSLDRGLWISIGLAITYLAVRYAARGRLAMLGVLFAVLAIVGVVLVATPFQSLISQRLSHGKSNAVRSSLSGIATRDALASPVIGFGDTRHEQGSTNSITVGKTRKCLDCGSRDIGGNGQLWMLLICDGFVGAGLYLAFFAYGCWRYWRDPTPYGMVGVLVLLLGFVFMIVYVAVGPALTFTMLVYALLWRNDRELRQAAAGSGEAIDRRQAAADGAVAGVAT